MEELGTFWRTCGRLDGGGCGDDGCDPVYELVVKYVHFSDDKTKWGVGPTLSGGVDSVVRCRIMSSKLCC